METQLTEVCLHLLTKAEVPGTDDPLDRIWQIDNWVRSLNRVIDIRVQMEDARRQRFSLTFDGGRDFPDQIEVERVRTERAIQVIHVVPPPEIKSLSAVWWSEVSTKRQIFARRTIVMEQCNYSPGKARHMFSILRENLLKLVGQEQQEQQEQ